MNLNIVLHSYLWQNNFIDENVALKLTNLHLNKLIKKAKISVCNFNYNDLIHQPFFKCDIDDLALDLAKQLGISQSYKNFLLATPIHLLTSNNSLYIDHHSIIELNDFEIKTIIQEINSYFKDEIKLFEVKNNLLLIGINIETNYTTKNISPTNMLNKHIYPEDIKILKDNNLLKLNNEIQMVLFNSKLNSIRLKQKKLPINSLWLYNYKNNDNLDLYQIINNKNLIYNKNYLLNQNTIDHTLFIDKDLIKLQNPNNWLDNIIYYDEVIFKDMLNLFNKKKIKLINIFIPKSNKTIKIKIVNDLNLLFWRNNNFYSIFKDTINEI
jgi:hypothetical protein